MFLFPERSSVRIYRVATQCFLSSLELRVQFCLLVCCTYPSSSTVNKVKNLIDQRASLRVDTRETQQYACHECHCASKIKVRGGVGCLLVGYLTSQQHANISQGPICSVNFTCCHTEIEVADQTFHLTQSQYTDNGPTSPRTDPITPGAWQGNHWSANFENTGMTRSRKNHGVSGIRTRDLPLSKRTP